MSTTLTQLHLPDELSERFDELAQHSGQSREEIMLEALQAYLVQIAEEDARIDGAIAAVSRGEVIDVEAAHGEVEAFIATLGVSPERRARIREEVEAALDAAYGPCASS